MRHLFTSIICLLLLAVKAQNLAGKSTYDNISAKDRTQFIVPIKQEEYELAATPYIPSYRNRKITDSSYCNAISIDAFDPTNLKPGEGIALFRNKHQEPMYVKNAQWFLYNSDNLFNQLFSEGDAELLLTRDGKWFYHFGWMVHESAAFGWNIYTRADGKFEFGMVGATQALYPLEVLDYSLDFENYQSKEIIHKGKKRKYYGQMKDDEPHGFGLILNELQHVQDYGFWENGEIKSAKSLLDELHAKHGVKTEEWRGKKIAYGNIFNKKRRTLSGFFDKSRKTRMPYGWFVSTYHDDKKIAAYAGYFPMNDKFARSGALKSHKESYGIQLCKRKTYNGYWVKKPSFSGAPFKTANYKFSDSEYLNYVTSGIPYSAAATVPALTFNYTPNKILEAQRKAKELAEQKRLAQMKVLYDAAIAKPGELVKNSSGRIFYVDRINQQTHCLELYPFPFTSTNYDLAQRSQDGSHQYPGKTYCRYHMSNADKSMIPHCQSYGLSVVNLRICPQCSGSGEVLKKSSITTDGGTRETHYYHQVGNIIYKKTYKTPLYGQKTVWVGVTCPNCRGVGYH